MNPLEACRCVEHMPDSVRMLMIVRSSAARRFWAAKGVSEQSINAAQIATMEIVMIEHGALRHTGWWRLP